MYSYMMTSLMMNS